MINGHESGLEKGSLGSLPSKDEKGPFVISDRVENNTELFQWLLWGDFREVGQSTHKTGGILKHRDTVWN